MARQDRRRPAPYVPLIGADLYEAVLMNTAADMVRITGEDVAEDVPQSFIVRSLLELGRAGYIPDGGARAGWYRATAAGDPLRYGFRSRLWCTTANEINGFYMNAPRVKEIRANATATAIRPMFRIWAEQLNACDAAIMANIEANRYGRMIGVPDEQKTEVEIALQTGRNGAPAIVRNSLLAAFQNSDISVPYTAGNTASVRQLIWSNALRQIGGMCAEQARQERTQTAEVNAGIGESIDHIYTMIDQFNADCKYHGIRARMEFNGFAARYDETPAPAVKDVDGVEGGTTDEQNS